MNVPVAKAVKMVFEGMRAMKGAAMSDDASTAEERTKFFNTIVPAFCDQTERAQLKLDGFMPVQTVQGEGEPTADGPAEPGLSSFWEVRNARKGALAVTNACLSTFDALTELHKNLQTFSPAPAASDPAMASIQEELAALKKSTEEERALHLAETRKLKGRLSDHDFCDKTISGLNTIRTRYQFRCDRQMEVLQIVSWLLKKQLDSPARAPTCDIGQVLTNIEEGICDWETADISEDRDTTLACLKLLLHIANGLKDQC